MELTMNLNSSWRAKPPFGRVEYFENRYFEVTTHSIEDVEKLLKAEGFAVSLYKDSPNCEHFYHDLVENWMILVYSGSMTVTCENQTFVLNPGDILTLPMVLEHKEVIGPAGCTYFICADKD